MGHFVVQLCPWLTVLATLGSAAAIEGDTNYRRDVQVAVDAHHLCPCIVRAECPRVLGSKPEDVLLGPFPPCEIKDTVRCCGVTTSLFVQRSTFENPPSGTVYPVRGRLPGYLGQRSQAEFTRSGSEVREGVAKSLLRADEETREYYLEDEFSDEGSEADRLTDGYERGKNIDSGISQTDASLASDFLDYRGVSKYPTTGEEDYGERTTSATDHGRGQQRGEISSSEKSSLTSTSSASSSVGKIERVVTRKKETAERSTQVQGENLVELSHADGRETLGSLDGTEIIEPPELTESETKGLGVIPATLNATAREISTNEATVGTAGKKSSAIYDQQYIADEDSWETYDYADDTKQLGTRESAETTLKDHRETSSLGQQESAKVTKESSIFKEGSLSTLTGNDQQQLTGSTKPITQISRTKIESQATDESVYDELAKMSRQQSSESQTKESSNIEGSSSSSSKTVVTNARDTTDKAVNSETFSVSSESVPKILISTTFRRRTLVPKVSTTYGENKETSQQSSQSVAEESSKVEKITSNSQSVATNREGAIDADVNSEDSDVTLGQVSTFRRPSLLRRPSVGLIGDTAYVQREETASQQSSDSSKTESLKVEETKSKSQSIAFNREGVIDANVISEDSDASSDVTLGQVSISRRPSLPRRPSVGLIGDTSYVQREETASQQSSNSSKTESLKVEETKSKSQSIAFNREGVIDANVNSEDSDASSDVTLGQVSIFRRPSLPRRPSVGLRGDTAYVDRKEISSQESSVLSRTESSKVAESTSSISQTGTASRQDLSEKDLKSRDLDTNLKPLVEAQRPVLSGIPSLGMRGDIVYGELKKTSSQQKSESLNDVSSKEEKIESSNVKSVSTNTENLTNDRSNLELKGGTIIKQSDTKTVSKTKLNSKSESSSSMERENFAKKSSDTSTTSTESNLINVITGKPVIMITDNPISWETAGQAYYPVLINAGFLKDRPVSTGLVGLDPLSGVTHSDLRDSEVAAELLPLSCGNVIFGERNTGGKMLLCDLPRPGDKPYQFLRGDTSTISSEKLNGPDLPGVILPGTGLNAKDDEIPYNPMFLDAEKSINQKPARRRIILKRPNAAHREFNVNEDIREVGSKQAAMESVSTSSSTVKKASSLEESTFSPSFGKEITKSKFDVSSAEDFNAEGAKGALNSKFYSLSQESIRPHPVTRDSSTAGEKEPTAIVEVVDSAPSTETKINLKRLRVSSSDDKLPRNDLEVLNIKTSEDNGANVEEERFVRPAETTRRRRLKFNRLPGRVQRAVISPDDISMSGRINVVGPIPAGYIDPALIREDEIGIELPRQHVTSSFQLLNIERQQEARDRGCTAFKPSPVDPINWPK